MRPGMRYCPCPSTTRAPLGTRHSPADPAQTIRSPRTRVTAFGTGARPVPSQSVAPTIAMSGLIGVGGRSGAGAGLQAAESATGSEVQSHWILMRNAPSWFKMPPFLPDCRDRRSAVSVSQIPLSCYRSVGPRRLRGATLAGSPAIEARPFFDLETGSGRRAFGRGTRWAYHKSGIAHAAVPR